MTARQMITPATVGFLLLAAAGSAGLAAEETERHAPWAATFDAQFRGCDDAGACHFWIDARDAYQEGLYRVRPDGVTWIVERDQTARAVRDRLNALLSNMIHQHKRVELHGMRSLGDATYAARVTVNGADLADDPVLAQLSSLGAAAPR